MKENIITIIDGEKQKECEILFTCDYKDRQVVFFMVDDENVDCAFYDGETLEELGEEDYKWASEVLEAWENEQDEQG